MDDVGDDTENNNKTERNSVSMDRDPLSMATAFNRGRIYDCGRVPPLPKQTQKQKQKQTQTQTQKQKQTQKQTQNQSQAKNSPFALISFLTSSHTNRRRRAFSESGWRRRIERGQITVEKVVVRDPEFVLLTAKHTVEYHRRPWKEPVLEVVVAGSEAATVTREDGGDYESERVISDETSTYTGTKQDSTTTGTSTISALTILHIDDHLLVVHKPSGLPTMPSQTYFEYCVLNALRRLYEEGESHQEYEHESRHGRKCTATGTSTSTSNINAQSQTPPETATTNVFATAQARQLIRSHCSAPPQPVHRLGVGTSGVLVLATSLLGRQTLTDAIRLKSHSSNININGNDNNISSSRNTVIRKVYRALVYARRCDDRPGITESEGGRSSSNNNTNGPLIPDVMTIDCPIGLVPYPIGGDSIHAACPSDSESLYGNVHVSAVATATAAAPTTATTTAAPAHNSPNIPNDGSSGKNQKQNSIKPKSGTKPALSHARVLDWKILDGVETALVEVEIPTGRPHQIRIHMAYAGHPLVGDPLYLPGGIPDCVPRNFVFRNQEDEDMDTDDDDDDGDENENIENDNDGATEAFVERVALPRDCGYHLHAHTITLEHPCCDHNPAAKAIALDNPEDDDAAAAAAATDHPTTVAQQATAMTFTAPPPPLLRQRRGLA